MSAAIAIGAVGAAGLGAYLLGTSVAKKPELKDNPAANLPRPQSATPRDALQIIDAWQRARPKVDAFMATLVSRQEARGKETLLVRRLAARIAGLYANLDRFEGFVKAELRGAANAGVQDPDFNSGAYVLARKELIAIGGAVNAAIVIAGTDLEVVPPSLGPVDVIGKGLSAAADVLLGLVPDWLVFALLAVGAVVALKAAQ